jgi:hypothetical protein
MKYIKLFENFNNTLINESYSLQDFINSSEILILKKYGRLFGLQ